MALTEEQWYAGCNSGEISAANCAAHYSGSGSGPDSGSGSTTGGTIQLVGDKTDTLQTNATNIINAIIGVIGIVAVVVIIIGGVQYMTSSGDAGKVKKAKDTILYGVIGLVVVALAYAIVNFVIKNIIG